MSRSNSINKLRREADAALVAWTKAHQRWAAAYFAELVPQLEAEAEMVRKQVLAEMPALRARIGRHQRLAQASLDSYFGDATEARRLNKRFKGLSQEVAS